MFGAFVALSLWLPRYLIGVYGFGIATAGMIGALYSIPASIFRAYGGVLSDRLGARTVMYWSLGVSAVATLILSLPPTNTVMRGIKGDIAIHLAEGQSMRAESSEPNVWVKCPASSRFPPAPRR